MWVFLLTIEYLMFIVATVKCLFIYLFESYIGGVVSTNLFFD
jgi:hypothetical protein